MKKPSSHKEMLKGAMSGGHVGTAVAPKSHMDKMKGGGMPNMPMANPETAPNEKENDSDTDDMPSGGY